MYSALLLCMTFSMVNSNVCSDVVTPASLRCVRQRAVHLGAASHDTEVVVRRCGSAGADAAWRTCEMHMLVQQCASQRLWPCPEEVLVGVPVTVLNL